MQQTLITISEYSRIHQIEESFLLLLEENGLIELTLLNNQKYIQHRELNNLERFINLHYELEVNPAGLAIAQQLFDKINALQEKLSILQYQLKNLQQGQIY